MTSGLLDLGGFARIGQILAEKYRVERIVGSGGMGVVVAALHVHLRTRVAIKLLLPRIVPRPSDRERLVERFMREARAAGRIRNAHVVKIFDVDLRDDGTPYIVMEFLEGLTLSQHIRNRGRLEVIESVDCALEACEALAGAHKVGIVHRDLKPANLFLTDEGELGQTIKLLDFGIAKSLEQQHELTGELTSGAFLGSPPYMSPEQLEAPAGVDERTDIWSLGTVLYECLAGVSPFASQTVGQVCARILHDTPPPLTSFGIRAPEGLEAVIRCCLAKRKDDRPATIGVLARALCRFGSARSARSVDEIEKLLGSSAPLDLRARPVSPAPASSDANADTETALTTRVPTPSPTRARSWFSLAALALLIGVLSASAMTSRRARDPSRAAASAKEAAPVRAPVTSAPKAAKAAAEPEDAGATSSNDREQPSVLETAAPERPRRSPRVPSKPSEPAASAASDPEAVYLDRR